MLSMPAYPSATVHAAAGAKCRGLAAALLLLGGCGILPREDPAPMGIGAYAADTAVLYGFTWAWTYAIDPDTRRGVDKASFDRWGDTISDAPVWTDGSDNVTNNVYHPLAGAFYYEYMRARGYSRLASASQTLLQSVLFEYTVEGLYTTPSAQALVKTTGIGVPLGIVADELSRRLIASPQRAKRILGYALNPMYLLPCAHGRPPRLEVTTEPLGFRIVFDF
jgi:hypothetical protein